MVSGLATVRLRIPRLREVRLLIPRLWEVKVTYT